MLQLVNNSINSCIARENPFNKLPDDIMDLILSNLSGRERARIATTYSALSNHIIHAMSFKRLPNVLTQEILRNLAFKDLARLSSTETILALATKKVRKLDKDSATSILNKGREACLPRLQAGQWAVIANKITTYFYSPRVCIESPRVIDVSLVLWPQGSMVYLQRDIPLYNSYFSVLDLSNGKHYAGNFVDHQDNVHAIHFLSNKRGIAKIKHITSEREFFSKHYKELKFFYTTEIYQSTLDNLSNYTLEDLKVILVDLLHGLRALEGPHPKGKWVNLITRSAVAKHVLLKIEKGRVVAAALSHFKDASISTRFLKNEDQLKEEDERFGRHFYPYRHIQRERFIVYILPELYNRFVHLLGEPILLSSFCEHDPAAYEMMTRLENQCWDLLKNRKALYSDRSHTRYQNEIE